MMRRVLAFLAVVTALGGCHDKGTLDRSQVHNITLEGRRYEVRVAPTGEPNEYSLMVVRATLVVRPDAAAERERNSNVAGQVMERVCKGRYRTLDENQVETVNYYVRFRCQT